MTTSPSGLEHLAAAAWNTMTAESQADLDRESWIDGFVTSAGVFAGIVPQIT